MRGLKSVQLSCRETFNQLFSVPSICFLHERNLVPPGPEPFEEFISALWLLKALGFLCGWESEHSCALHSPDLLFLSYLIYWGDINKTEWVSSVHFYNTWSVYCIVHPPPEVKLSSVTIYPTPSYPYYLPTPPPYGSHHTVICVHEFQFFITHMSEIIWFLAFSDWLILLSIIFSRFIHVVTKQNFIFPVAE